MLAVEMKKKLTKKKAPASVPCEACGHQQSPAKLSKALGVIYAGMRKTHTGPPKVYYTCTCGETMTSRDTRTHNCGRPDKPAYYDMRPATAAEVKRLLG